MDITEHCEVEDVAMDESDLGIAKKETEIIGGLQCEYYKVKDRYDRIVASDGYVSLYNFKQ